MKRFKIKLIVLAIIVMLGILAFNVSVYASNENIEIIKKETGKYLIYVKDCLDENFQFAFSNNKEETNLVFDDAETDSNNEKGNKIAFVNSSKIGLFENKTYMWVKNANDNYILEGIEVDLSKAIHEYDLEFASNITKSIPTKTEQKTTVEEVDGKKVTTTIGNIVLPETENNYTYVLLKVKDSEKNKNLFDIANKISKITAETDMYSKIKEYKSFLESIEIVKANINESDFIKVNGNEIAQPNDAEDGEEYILFINENNSKGTIKSDIHFLTSTRVESEEKIVEKITTKLPVTYDNNTLLIILAVLIVLIIAVSIRIKVLNKKQEK